MTARGARATLSRVTLPSERRAELVAAARAARARAHCPYSGFAVGAALLCADGTVVTGANVENSSYGLTLCAERAAVVRAVAEGRREFVAIAVATGAPTPTQPCGACRQVLAEFAPTLPVFAVGAGEEVAETTLGTLLPHRFEGPPS